MTVMKRILFIMMALASMATGVRGANPAPAFGVFDKRNGFEYTCLSPGKDAVDKKGLSGVPMEKISFVEMVSTREQGCGQEFKKSVSQAISGNGLELMSARDDDRKRNEFYAAWDSDRGVFTHLLLIKYRDAEHCNAKLMFLTGELTPADFSRLFEIN